MGRVIHSLSPGVENSIGILGKLRESTIAAHPAECYNEGTGQILSGVDMSFLAGTEGALQRRSKGK